MVLHKSLAIGDIHVPYQWSYADATARGAATGFVANDVGKLSRQLDDNSFWVLTDESPIAWVRLGIAVDSTAIHKATSAEISAITEKTTPVSADVLLLEDSADGYSKKRLSIGNFPGGLDTTAIHKATAAEISAMTEKTTPVSADLVVIEDSADGDNKKKVQLGNLPSSVVFGKNYQAAASDSRATTTSDVFQTKTTLTTPALTGTYRIGWTAVIDLSTSSSNVEAQLYNDTDAVIVGALIVWRGTINQERACVHGFSEITFTGAAKKFYIQYRSVNGTATAAIAAAKIELWRIS
jgi:hypothetical protein